MPDDGGQIDCRAAETSRKARRLTGLRRSEGAQPSHFRFPGFGGNGSIAGLAASRCPPEPLKPPQPHIDLVPTRENPARRAGLELREEPRLDVERQEKARLVGGVRIDPSLKEMCHNVHMKTISIRELHLKTGRWVRHAASRGPIVVTDRGRRVAALQPFDASMTGRPLPNREAAIRKRSKVPVDSAVYLSELREDR